MFAVTKEESWPISVSPFASCGRRTGRGNNAQPFKMEYCPHMQAHDHMQLMNESHPKVELDGGKNYLCSQT